MSKRSIISARLTRVLCVGSVLSLVPAALGAQGTLFVPRSVKEAYAKGTRQRDGRPGPAYWQNRARYDIDLDLLPPQRTVRGSERITYYNASPDTLAQVVIKLFMNSHRPGAPRTLGVADDYMTSGVHIDSFAVNDTPTTWEQGAYFTSVPVQLAKPLLPHDSVRLAFRWHYDLATRPAREGMIDSTTAYLAYFYPRVAVYDDYNGWDTMDFADVQEFYSDFNDYDVTVHVPANFVVWGTGTLTNPARVLQPTFLRRFTNSLGSDSTIHIATRAELGAGGVTTTGAARAWRFTASNVPDVAFGLSDHYDWDGASVVVDSAAHRRVSVQAAYNDTASDFHHMVQMARGSLAFLSTQLPGVAYPYEKVTVFQGGAGMEYPMMVNDESYPDTAIASAVAGHEIAHTYMPFYMGINETRYPFMDEGWAVTFEYPNNRRIMGPARAMDLYQRIRVMPWGSDPSMLVDLPILTPADAIRGVGTYRSNAYGKPSLGYLALEDYLGDAVFKRALHAYMDRWHGRHPSPWDLFNTFNEVSGRNLDWFWNQWFFRFGYIDLGVSKVARSPTGYRITLLNVGGYPAPVDLVLAFADGSRRTVHETIGIWERNQRVTTVAVPAAKGLRSLRLSGGIWMDADSSNDGWSTR